MGKSKETSAPKSMLERAREYALLGWHVFPLFYTLGNGTCSCNQPNCKRTGKHPISKNGLLNGSVEIEQITAWWTKHPHANIGLTTGYEGLVVIDIDISDGKSGAESLAKLEAANSPLPETLEAKSGSGGRHLYFRSSETIPSSANRVAPNVDVRGTGGYVILPPSNHKSGGKYEWRKFDHPIVEAPAWLVKLMLRRSNHISTDSQALLAAHSEDPAARAKKRATKYSQDKLTRDQFVELLSYIPPDTDYETWWHTGAALKTELGSDIGLEVWDDWSRKAPDKYDERTIYPKWKSFIAEKFTVGTIIHIAKQYGFKGFGSTVQRLEDVRSGWCYVASIKRFVKINTQKEWDKEQLDFMLAPLAEKGSLSAVLSRDASFRKLDGATYWPSKDRIVEEGGETKLNYWSPSTVIAREGDVTPFLNHARYLYPDPIEVDILLSYMAYQVQHPGEKIHWAVLLEGDQGNGKSYFATVLRHLLGDKNVRIINSDQLHETFTGWQRNTQFIVVEEMMAKQRLELMNKLKPMITQPTCQIREMYRPPYEQPNRFNFMFFSNHKDSLIIDNTDRRYCILSTKAPAHPTGVNYYTPLFRWTRGHAAELLYYLMRYDLSKFEPMGHAPMTAGKRELIRESYSPLEQYIDEQVSKAEYPCQCDLIKPATLVEPLKDVNISSNPKAIGKAFVKLGYQKLGQVREDSSSDGRKITMWAVRDLDRYREMPERQLREVFRLQMTNILEQPEKLSEAEIMRMGKPKNPVKQQKPF